MNNFEISTHILEEIVDKSISFSVAIKSNFQKFEVSRESGTLISGLVGCTLRHYLLLMAFCREKFSFENRNTYYPLMLMLANILFYKRFDNDQLIQSVAKRLDLKPREVNEFVTAITSKEELVPTNVDKASEEYLSIRFNTPLWLVKMWIKHLGKGLTYKLLKGNYTPNKTFVAVNTLKTNEDNILKNEGFEKAYLDNLLIYNGKMPLRKSKLMIDRNIYYDKPVIKELIDSLDIEPHYNVAIFSGFTNNAYLDLGMKMGLDMHVDIMAPSYQDYCDIKNYVKLFGFKNTNVFECHANSMLATISNKVDCFILFARNSNFDLLKTNPDYFLKLKRDSLDEVITEQRYSLEEAASLVNEKGTLVYAISTVNKKEGRMLTRDFLLVHNEFSLVEEKQIYSFDKQENSLYFAKMVNVGKPKW